MSILLRNNLTDLVLEDALPALEMIVKDEFDRFDPFYEKCFNVKEMMTSIAQSTQVSGYKVASTVGEGEEIPSQRRFQGFDKTYLAIKLGIMAAQSQELIDDLKFDVMSDNARQLALSIQEAIEIATADIFNSGFSTAGPDGVSLFNASHPLVAAGAGTDSNTLGTPADLTSTSLKAMITLMRDQKDMAGKKIHVKPSQLVVPPEEHFNAIEILESEMLVRSDNASVNAVNSIKSKYGIDVVVNDYLTDEDATFLLADKRNHKLCFYWRKRPEIDTDYDFRSEVALQKATCRYAVGYSDWRGTVGNSGGA